MSTVTHKKDAPKNLALGVLTASTTRTEKDDESGKWIIKQAKKEGHKVVFHKIVTDDIFIIRNTLTVHLEHLTPDAVIITGGTGLSSKDVTIEAVKPLFQKELTAFGPLFAQLSFGEIDSAAIMSRAVAGIIDRTVLFAVPGSIKAVKLALNNLIFPELGHIMKHILKEGK